MKRLVLAIALLAAAPALAQPPTDWTKPVTGVDAPAASAPETMETFVIYRLNHGDEKPKSIFSDLVIAAAADTPLPPPCEPPPVRSVVAPPEPSSPPPAPCRP